jgi:mlo protein
VGEARYGFDAMGAGKGFDAADSWNVALLFLIYAVLSVGIEHGVHWFKTKVKGQKTLMLVVDKAEEELFLLGTVSFLLLVFEESIINNSCVDSSIFDGDNWALCHKAKYGYYGSGTNSTGSSYSGRRRLHGAVGGGDGICPDGEEPFFSAALLHHVHIFIFLLAISHVLYTAATLTLARWRLKVMMSRRTEHLRVTMERVAKLMGKDAHEINADMERRRLEEVRSFRRADEGLSRKSSSSLRDEGGGGAPPESLQSSADMKAYRLKIADATTAALKGDVVNEEELFSDIAAKSAPKKSVSFAWRQRTAVAREDGQEYRNLWTRFLHGIAWVVPNSSLLCFELLFLRTHNIHSYKFDFSSYVMQCIESNSSETLGMSPARWLIATVLILLWGPFREMNLAVSVVSFASLIASAALLSRRVEALLHIERSVGQVTDDVFLFRRPQLLEEVMVAIMYQQAFHIASWLFGWWNVGSAWDGYSCYYGEGWGLAVSVVVVAASLAIGGYVILPLQALTSQMTPTKLKGDLLGPHVKGALDFMLRKKRRVKKFPTETDAVVHIQRCFRKRRQRNLEMAGRMAMINEVSQENRKYGMTWVNGGGGDADGTPRSESPSVAGDSIIDVDV